MASQVSGACCVCGTTTTQRCSSCGSAGFSLFFCSREHQKVVHFVHKHVCGKNAKPFRFPHLSDEEVTEAIASIDAPVPAPLGVKGLTIRGELEPLLPRKDDIPNVIKDLSRPSTAATTRNAILLCLIRSTLRDLHAIDHDIASQVNLLVDLPEELLRRTEPLSCVSYFIVTLVRLMREQSGLLGGFSLHNDKHIRLLHHAFIYAALHYRFAEAEIKEPHNPMAGYKHGLFLREAMNRLHECLTAIAKEDNALAKTIEEAMGLFTGAMNYKVTLDGVVLRSKK